MVDLARAVVRLEADNLRLQRDLDRANGAIRNFERRAAAASKRIGFAFTSNLVKPLAALAAGFTAVGTVRGIVEISDSYQLLQGRLGLVTDSTEQLRSVTNALFDSAQETRTEFAAVASLYTRLAQATKRYGVEQQQLLELTKLTNQAFVISGANGTEAAAGVQQFGQALQSGVLAGDELKSLAENAPRLLNAIVDGIKEVNPGLGLTRENVRKLGSEGKITTDLIVAGLRTQADVLNNEFAKVPRTVGQALTQLRNEFFRSLGTADTSPIIDAIDKLRERVKDPAFQKALVETANGIAQLVAVLARAGAALGSLFAAFDREASQDKIIDLGDRIAQLRAEIEQKERGKTFLTSFGRDVESELTIARTNLKAYEKDLADFAKSAVRSAVPTLPALGPDVAIPMRLPTPPKFASAPSTGAGEKIKTSEAARLIEQLEQQLIVTKDLTEAERVRFGLANGTIEASSKAEATRLQLLADEVTRRDSINARIAEQTDLFNSLKDSAEKYREALRTPAEAFEIQRKELEKLRDAGVLTASEVQRTLGGIRLDQLGAEIDKVIAKFERAQQSAAARVQTGELSQPAGQAQVRAAAQEAQAALAGYRGELEGLAAQGVPNAEDALARLSQSFGQVAQSTASGLTLALQGLRAEVTNLNTTFVQDAAQAGVSSLTTAFRSLGDASTTAGEKVRAFLSGFAGQLADIASRALATIAVTKLLESVGGVLGGGNPNPGTNAAAGAAYAGPIIAAGGVLTTAGGTLAAAAVPLGAVAVQLQAAAAALPVASTASAVGGLPGFADGGTMKAGLTAVVGERGPELFTAPMTGRIIPNEELGGGGRPINIRNVNAFDTAIIGDYLAGSDAEQVILNVVTRNGRRIRNSLAGS